MKQLFIFLSGLLLLYSSVVAQKIDFSVRYNSSTGEYEVYGRPNFSAATFNVGGGSQLTVVLPQSVANNALTITSVNGGVWVDNSRVYAPAAAPTLDFHGVSTTGAPMAWPSGTETLLFKFTLGGACVAGVRLFENATDPQSNAAGMLGGDFNNYFANALTFADVYQSNYNNTGTSCSVAPVANPDIAVTPQDKPVNGNVLTNDDDPQGGTLVVTTTPVTPPTKGTVTLRPDGSFTYTPSPGKTGEEVFCYEVSNAQGLKDTACVTLDIVPNPIAGNDAPVAADDNTETPKNTPVVINVKANDSDPDGNVLGTPTRITNPTNGTATVNPDGTITYTPNSGFVGTDMFKYSVCDNGVPSRCDTATVTVRVNEPVAGNQPPIAVDDATVTSVNTPVSGTVASNDYDPDNNAPLTFTRLSTPSNGTVVFNSNGTYTYTPNTGYTGNDSFLYRVCDSGSPSKCDTATVSIAVLPKAPVCLQAKVYLQGALFGVFLPDSLMRDDLRVQGYLPTSSPYPAMGMSGITNRNTTTSAVVGASSASGKDAIVDWVFVELRSATDPTVIVDSRSALLQRDGDIVDVDGVSSVTFNAATSGSYYVSVKHRNHLGVMTKTAIDLSQGCTVVDFRKPSTPTYNLDASNAVNVSQVDVVQGVAMWAGNALGANVADGRHEVIYQGTDNDVNVIYQQVINATGNTFVLPSYKLRGYYSGDINLNGEVIFQGTGNDVEFIYQNVIKNHVGNTLKLPFFKIREQLP